MENNDLPETVIFDKENGELIWRRSLVELEIRATAHRHEDGMPISTIIGDDLLKIIVEGKVSPNKAFKLAYMRTHCLGCAKAARWLAVIVREYGSSAAEKVRELM